MTWIPWIFGAFGILGALVTFVIAARAMYAHEASRYATSRDGEAMVFSALAGLFAAVFWPVLAVGVLIRWVFDHGVFDVIFIRPDHRANIKRRERDKRIRALEQQVRDREQEFLHGDIVHYRGTL